VCECVAPPTPSHDLTPCMMMCICLRHSGNTAYVESFVTQRTHTHTHGDAEVSGNTAYVESLVRYFGIKRTHSIHSESFVRYFGIFLYRKHIL